MAFQVISKNYLDVLTTRQLLHFLEFNYHDLEHVKQLRSSIIQNYIEKKKISESFKSIKVRNIIIKMSCFIFKIKL